ncbi:MAG: sodium/proton-translocating pyrophosphatase, partial [Gammaproteobacteria bacterium]|nr:sodium/proton-translocating pyrophosphatase [Gammaproteobacteria bacterium]
MSTGLLIAIVCALIGIAYGVISIFSILSKPMGNDKMVEIATAIQEGAIAYLARQYTTIGMVGIVLFFAMGFALGWYSAVGFA